MPPRAIGRHPVRTGQHAGRHVRHARTVRADVAALGVEVFVLQRKNSSCLVGRDPHAMDLLARMVRGHQMLVPIFDPFDRPPQPQSGKTDQNVLGIELAANPESASGVSLEQMNGRGAAPERLRQQIAGAVRDLGGAVHLEDVAHRVVAGDRAARLQWHARMTADLELELDDCVGGAKARVGIAVFLADDRGLGQHSLREFAGRTIRGKDRRQILDFDRNKLRRILRKVGALGEDRRHRLADIADAVDGQDRLAIGQKLLDPALAEVDWGDVADMLGRPYRPDAFMRAGGLDIDRTNAAVRTGRAHDAHVQLVGEGYVGGKSPLAGHQWTIFKAGDRAAYEFFLHADLTLARAR
jgi:hypothetical protein